MQVDYQIVGQGNGCASPFGLIRKVVILAIKSDGIGNLHVCTLWSIYISLLPLTPHPLAKLFE